jgi:polar amino acid transport system substrate-binding protein
LNALLLLCYIGIATASAVASLGIASAATLDEIKARGYIVVATEDDCPPFEYVTHGVRTGFDHDLLVAFAQTSGLEVRHQVVPWQDIIPGVASGRYDLAATAAVASRERAKLVDFTTPTAEMTMRYMKRAADRSIGGVKDLSGKTIGVQKDAGSADVIPTLKETLRKAGGKLGKIVEYKTYADAYQDLLKRRIDAVINNGEALTQLAASTSGVFEVGPTVGPKVYAAWAVLKANRPILYYINVFLAQHKSSGRISELQRKYNLTGGQLPERPLPRKAM